MCGIVGSFSISKVDLGVFNNQLKAITHRGPDDEGTWFNEERTIALGSRRLAIQDTSSNGHMPMSSEDGKYILVFNGEIYNFPELKKKLENHGFLFKSNSDTEVVLNAYIYWGVNCLDYFEGMFAIAVFNNQSGDLFIARDRAGEKPIHYWINKDGLDFGSELKSLFENPRLERILNPKAFYQYLENGYCTGETSFIKGVDKLKQGNYLIYNTKNSTLQIHQYWTPPKSSSSFESKEKLVDRLDKLLSDSVKKQLVSDVPLGVLLSGGVDSSLITAYASQHVVDKINTFHISFDGFGKYNEKEYARAIANHFDTNHIELSGNDLSYSMIDELMDFYDEPLADSSMLPTFLVSKLTKKYVTVALGGDGGDELFGGYTNYPMVQKHQKNKLPKSVRQLISSSSSILPTGMKGRNYLMSLKGNEYERFLYNRLFDKTSLKKTINQQYWIEFIQEDTWNKTIENSGNLVYDMLKYDFQNNLVDDILVKVDRASMATSLEMRAPWLDRNVIEFAFRDVPNYLKTEGNNLKILPKTLLKRKLNFDFDLNRKQGFSIPLHQWIRDKWEKEFKQELNNLPNELFNKTYINSLLEGIKKGYTNSSKLYAIVIMGKWLKKHNIKY